MSLKSSFPSSQNGRAAAREGYRRYPNRGTGSLEGFVEVSSRLRDSTDAAPGARALSMRLSHLLGTEPPAGACVTQAAFGGARSPPLSTEALTCRVANRSPLPAANPPDDDVRHMTGQRGRPTLRERLPNRRSRSFLGHPPRLARPLGTPATVGGQSREARQPQKHEERPTAGWGALLWCGMRLPTKDGAYGCHAPSSARGDTGGSPNVPHPDPSMRTQGSALLIQAQLVLHNTPPA